MQQANLEPSPLRERISEKYENLSKRERLLADIVLTRLRDFAGYTATELAEQAKVSKATATRFFRRLGYNDFEEARLEARGSPYSGSPLEAFCQSQPIHGNPSDADIHVASELNNISETFRTVVPEDLNEAVRLLVAARRVWIIGFRDSYGVAVQADSMLTRIVADVRLLPRLGMSLAEDLSSMRRGDAVLAIGFRRRPRIFHSVLKVAHDLGGRIILLTDTTASLGCIKANVVLRCNCHFEGALFDSHISGLSLLNLICSRVGRWLDKSAKTRLQAAERIHDGLDDLPPSRLLKRGREWP